MAIRQFDPKGSFTILFQPVDPQSWIDKELSQTVFGLAGGSGEPLETVSRNQWGDLATWLKPRQWRSLSLLPPAFTSKKPTKQTKLTHDRTVGSVLI